MGFDVLQVLSDDTHYSPFLCSVCQNLVTLDAIVTSRCSHPFCLRCLEQWADQSQNENAGCCCPACKTDLSENPSIGSMQLGTRSVAAKPLREAQPLAYQVLALVQVACMDTSKQKCEWSGNYADFLKHAASHGSNSGAMAFVSPRPNNAPLTPQQENNKEKLRPSLSGFKSASLPCIFRRDENNSAQDAVKAAAQRRNARSPQRPHRPAYRACNSLRDFNDAEAVDQTLFPDKSPQSPVSMNGIQRTPTRRPANNSISSLPVTPKSPLRGNQRPGLTNSPVRQANSPMRQASSPMRQTKLGFKRKSSDDLENSYSKNLDWNMSINSLGGWNTSFHAEPMETLKEEEKDFKLEFEDDDESTTPEDKTRKIVEKAGKLKKQANAKFNKGDFVNSRSLYSEGIKVMSAMTPVSSEECELLSNMYSNRAVTFFREKKFDSCVEDCDRAIRLDPTYEKTWIRKWRALMALGTFDAAFNCLDLAAKTIPESARIQEELEKAREEKELLDQAKEFLEKSEFQKAKDLLKPHARTSDNIGLLFLAAAADTSLGHTESALEKVNKALRFNPSHIDGLALRGYTLFLSGETEKGGHILQEAHNRQKENTKIKTELARCQKTHSAFTKGRAYVKRGRWPEAVEHFSNAMKESGPIPYKAPLFALLRTERAEAWLLSGKFVDALKDCQEVINANEENATAWTIRADVLIALGKVREARAELLRARRNWGADNPTIEEGFKRVDFELRVMQANEDLMKFVTELESGDTSRLNIEKNHYRESEHGRSHRKSERKSRGSSSDRKPSRMKDRKSSRDYDDTVSMSDFRRKDKGTSKVTSREHDYEDTRSLREGRKKERGERGSSKMRGHRSSSRENDSVSVISRKEKGASRVKTRSSGRDYDDASRKERGGSKMKDHRSNHDYDDASLVSRKDRGGRGLTKTKGQKSSRSLFYDDTESLPEGRRREKGERKPSRMKERKSSHDYDDVSFLSKRSGQKLAVVGRSSLSLGDSDHRGVRRCQSGSSRKESIGSASCHSGDRRGKLTRRSSVGSTSMSEHGTGDVRGPVPERKLSRRSSMGSISMSDHGAVRRTHSGRRASITESDYGAVRGSSSSRRDSLHKTNSLVRTRR